MTAPQTTTSAAADSRGALLHVLNLPRDVDHQLVIDASRTVPACILWNGQDDIAPGDVLLWRGTGEGGHLRPLGYWLVADVTDRAADPGSVWIEHRPLTVDEQETCPTCRGNEDGNAGHWEGYYHYACDECDGLGVVPDWDGLTPPR